jgi:uncharacterized protein YdeI (YjbR/CyaY-like superfamily)
MAKKIIREPELITAGSAADWRKWLQKNHQEEDKVWLVYYKKGSGKPSVEYSDAVDEALCFGWIDSKAVGIDEEKYKQFFCKRKPTSVWSKVNKAKIEKLIAANKMTEAGFKCIEIAKQNGSWTILDAVEELIIPDDLEKLFSKAKKAKENFIAFSRTDKRNILQWIALAKRPETRLARITEVVGLAKENKKPKQFMAK